jgi:hypothetical protein
MTAKLSTCGPAPPELCLITPACERQVRHAAETHVSVHEVCGGAASIMWSRRGWLCQQDRDTSNGNSSANSSRSMASACCLASQPVCAPVLQCAHSARDT